MRRVVLDPGVLVSALINPSGVPGSLLPDIRGGAMELIVSPLLLEELEGVLSRDKFRRYFDPSTAGKFVDLLRHDATVVSDPKDPPPLRSVDPDDDYLIALAHDQNAVLVSGDEHLLDIGGGAPILAPSDLTISALTGPR